MSSLNATPCLILFVFTSAAAQHNNSSAMCAPFPHLSLYCARYFDADTAVYVDNDVLNYTAVNNEIEFLVETGVFGIVEDTCRPLTAYVACQYVYPRCNDTTQALVPVCVDSCLNFAQQCFRQFERLTVLSASVQLTSELLNVNCTNQFSAFGSINIDTNPDSCYNYYTQPMFLPSTTLNVNTDNLRFVVFSDDDTYTPFCSELRNRSIAVTCRAGGDPQPAIEIYGIATGGNEFTFPVTFRRVDELAIGHDPLWYGQILNIYCRASNVVTTLTISITLTHTCCKDDGGNMQYSIGQEFITSNSCRCLCGDNGNITCDFLNCGSSTSNGATVVVIVVTVVATIVIVILVLSVIFCVIRWFKNNKDGYTTGANIHSHSTVPRNGQKISIDSGNFLLTDIDVQESPISDAVPSDCMHGKLKDTLTPLSNLEHSTSLRDLFNSFQEDNFKPTPQLIRNTMIEHRLKDFIKPFDCLTICETLGEGEFGKVFHGYIQNEMNSSSEIAVKTMKNCSNMDELNLFISESVIMKDFKHRNVLGLVGVSVGVEEDKAVPYIILPYMANGNLKGYLKDKRLATGGNFKSIAGDIDYLTLVRMCWDICNGMKYLASIRFVHRDLAARNCMVDKDLVIKVADFGLARDIYSDDYYRMGHKAKVPIKWMPPESIHDRYYDQKTDVWSFGVVCWEVLSLGKAPYPGVDNNSIPGFIASGGRLPKPSLRSDELYQIMLSCWQLKNSDRPVFSTLAEQLEQHYSDVMESNPSDPSSPYLPLT